MKILSVLATIAIVKASVWIDWYSGLLQVTEKLMYNWVSYMQVIKLFRWPQWQKISILEPLIEILIIILPFCRIKANSPAVKCFLLANFFWSVAPKDLCSSLITCSRLVKVNKFSKFFIPGDLELCSSFLLCSHRPKVSKFSEFFIRVIMPLLVAEPTNKPFHHELTLQP